MLKGLALPLLVASIGWSSCTTHEAPPIAPSASPSESARIETNGAPSAIASASNAVAVASPGFAELVASLSEPDGPFFSDNFISNETSYLQVASSLPKHATPGGAYIGVGPEQNFTYIAMTRPKLAFVIDIRRGNLIVQLLYKAIFEEASSRAHFLTMLVGRPYVAEGDPGASGTIAQVIAHAEKKPADEATYRSIHDELTARIEKEIKLDSKDKRTLEKTHRAFFKGQLDIKFELKEENGRAYPTLRDLLKTKDPGDQQSGFLASEESFRFVQTMEKENRIIPVVGDFAGDRAMPGIAKYLEKEKLTVSAFYVSNVEQYLLDPAVWAKWSRNVSALPTDEKSLFIRCYLDQGKKHPNEMKGHRTATVIQRVADFSAHNAKKPYRDFFSISTDDVISD